MDLEIAKGETDGVATDTDTQSPPEELLGSQDSKSTDGVSIEYSEPIVAEEILSAEEEPEDEESDSIEAGDTQTEAVEGTEEEKTVGEATLFDLLEQARQEQYIPPQTHHNPADRDAQLRQWYEDNSEKDPAGAAIGLARELAHEMVASYHEQMVKPLQHDSQRQREINAFAQLSAKYGDVSKSLPDIITTLQNNPQWNNLPETDRFEFAFLKATQGRIRETVDEAKRAGERNAEKKIGQKFHTAAKSPGRGAVRDKTIELTAEQKRFARIYGVGTDVFKKYKGLSRQGERAGEL